MCEPTDDWPCKLGGSIDLERSGMDFSPHQTSSKGTGTPGASSKAQNDFTFPCGPIPAEDDDEVTESKIRAFLDEKVPSPQRSFFCEGLMISFCYHLSFFIILCFVTFT